MLCRITDEIVFEHEIEEISYKNLEDLNLYELMAQDFDVYVRANKNFGFDIEIESEDGEYKIREKGINPAAMESMADFCKSFLAFYNRANNIKGIK
jgi:hypothetical protein